MGKIPGRRRYLKAVGGSLGLLAFSDNVSADPSNGKGRGHEKSKEPKDKGPKDKGPNGDPFGQLPPGIGDKPTKPDPDFDPHDVEEVRGVNIAIRRVPEEVVKNWAEKLTDKQRQAIIDANKVTSTIVTQEVEIDGELKEVQTEIQSNPSVKKKWGWHK